MGTFLKLRTALAVIAFLICWVVVTPRKRRAKLFKISPDFSGLIWAFREDGSFASTVATAVQSSSSEEDILSIQQEEQLQSRSSLYYSRNESAMLIKPDFHALEAVLNSNIFSGSSYGSEIELPIQENEVTEKTIDAKQIVNDETETKVTETESNDNNDPITVNQQLSQNLSEICECSKEVEGQVLRVKETAAEELKDVVSSLLEARLAVNKEKEYTDRLTLQIYALDDARLSLESNYSAALRQIRALEEELALVKAEKESSTKNSDSSTTAAATEILLLEEDMNILWTLKSLSDRKNSILLMLLAMSAWCVVVLIVLQFRSLGGIKKYKKALASVEQNLEEQIRVFEAAATSSLNLNPSDISSPTLSPSDISSPRNMVLDSETGEYIRSYVDKLESSLAAMEVDFGSLQEMLSVSQGENSHLTQCLSALKESLAEYETVVSGLRNENSNLHAHLAVSQQNLEMTHNSLSLRIYELESELSEMRVTRLALEDIHRRKMLLLQTELEQEQDKSNLLEDQAEAHAVAAATERRTLEEECIENREQLRVLQDRYAAKEKEIEALRVRASDTGTTAAATSTNASSTATSVTDVLLRILSAVQRVQHAAADASSQLLVNNSEIIDDDNGALLSRMDALRTDVQTSRIGDDDLVKMVLDVVDEQKRQLQVRLTSQLGSVEAEKKTVEKELSRLKKRIERVQQEKEALADAVREEITRVRNDVSAYRSEQEHKYVTLKASHDAQASTIEGLKKDLDVSEAEKEHYHTVSDEQSRENEDLHRRWQRLQCDLTKLQAKAEDLKAQRNHLKLEHEHEQQQVVPRSRRGSALLNDSIEAVERLIDSHLITNNDNASDYGNDDSDSDSDEIEESDGGEEEEEEQVQVAATCSTPTSTGNGTLRRRLSPPHGIPTYYDQGVSLSPPHGIPTYNDQGVPTATGQSPPLSESAAEARLFQAPRMLLTPQKGSSPPPSLTVNHNHTAVVDAEKDVTSVPASAAYVGVVAGVTSAKKKKGAVKKNPLRDRTNATSSGDKRKLQQQQQQASYSRIGIDS